jgi:hypothetical protein
MATAPATATAAAAANAEWLRDPAFLRFIQDGQRLGEGWGSWVDWGIVLSLALCLTIIALIAVTRVRYRHRMAESGAVVLSLLSLGVLPVMLLPFANFTAVEYAKQVTFCESCHGAMDPYVADMRNPKGTSLAAMHFQDHFTPTQPGTECYSCHANYGVHGTFLAKLQGLGDAYHYVTGTWKAPITLREPFPNEQCLKCHVVSREFLAQPLHLDKTGGLSPAITGGQVSCGMCHPSGHVVGAS